MVKLYKEKYNRKDIMSRKRTTYSADFKAKVVLELLEGDNTLNEIASKYNLLPKNLQNWKKQFLDNASLAFDKSIVVKEYKEEIEKLKKEKDATSKKLGEVIIERDWAVGKLKSLDLSTKRRLISEGKVQAQKDIKIPSLNKQLAMLNISKTAHYYKPIQKFSSDEDLKLLNTIDKIHTKYPYYGTRRVEKLLKRLGFNVGRKLIKSAFEFMGIRALYPKIRTTIANKEHKKYPYLLDEFKNDNNQVIIDTPNKVWSTDITYIKLEKGFVYLAAIIDWHSKAILSWRISNTMDTDLVMGVLNEALSFYGKPEIFNTDQGSQYTSYIHTQTLKDNDIIISMDGKGRATDNICIERFWRSAKVEKIYLNEYERISVLKSDVEDYMEFYNYQRFHETLKYKKPMNVI